MEQTGNTGWAGPGFGPGPCLLVTEENMSSFVTRNHVFWATTKPLLNTPQVAQNEKLTFHEQVKYAL